MPDFPSSVIPKAAIAFLLSVLLVLFWYYRQALTPAYNRQPLALGIAFFLLRIVPFIGLYIVLGYAARSDVPMFFEASKEALEMKVVYRDFDSAYSPLFAYLTALPLLIWYSPEAITLLLILLEGLTLALTFRYYRSLPGPADEPFQKAILYLLLPISMVLSVLSGQEDELMWLFGVWALMAWRHRQDDLSVGLVLGLGMVVTKAILVLTLIPVFFLVRNQLRYVAGLLLVGLPALAIMYGLVGLEFLEPVQQANDPRTPNIWTVLRPLLGSVIPLGQKSLNWVGLASILAFGCYVAYRNRPRFEAGFVTLWVSTYAFMMIVQQSSLANYAYIYVMPMLFGVVALTSRNQLLFLLLFNVAVVVQPPLWWSMDMPLFSSLSDLTTAKAVAEYVLEVVIVGCLIWLLAIQFKAARLIGMSK
ncbi:hypothetical protein [Spirosoma sp. 209]|uniref:hypothetical protein n=1 Tax=Spirosoma sp. 209 TaxID=1955701 RepID=UPI00098D2A48|nr:hypothetical protein [Spirosoma sp. 209]